DDSVRTPDFSSMPGELDVAGAVLAIWDVPIDCRSKSRPPPRTRIPTTTIGTVRREPLSLLLTGLSKVVPVVKGITSGGPSFTWLAWNVPEGGPEDRGC